MSYVQENKMTNETKNKEEYVSAWNDHIDEMGVLCFVNSMELSKEVKETLNNLKELVVKVAEDKGLKEKQEEEENEDKE